MDYALCCRMVTESVFLCSTLRLQNGNIELLCVILHKISPKTGILGKYLSKKLDYLLHTRYNKLIRNNSGGSENRWTAKTLKNILKTQKSISIQ